MSIFSDWTTDEKKGFRKELGKAIATGTNQVKFADRQVTYRTLEEMRQTSRLLDEAIAADAGTRRARRLHIDSRKGFG